MRVASALLVALAVLGSSATALADGPVVEIDPIDIVGSQQRPGAFYVLERSSGRAEVVDLRTSFAAEIVRDADRLEH